MLTEIACGNTVGDHVVGLADSDAVTRLVGKNVYAQELGTCQYETSTPFEDRPIRRRGPKGTFRRYALQLKSDTP